MQANRAAASRSHFRQVAHQRLLAPRCLIQTAEHKALGSCLDRASAAHQRQLSCSCKATLLLQKSED